MYDFLAKLFMKKLDSNSIPVDITRSSAEKLKKQLDFATVMETYEHHKAIVNLSRHLTTPWLRLKEMSLCLHMTVNLYKLSVTGL